MRMGACVRIYQSKKKVMEDDVAFKSCKIREPGGGGGVGCVVFK